MAGLLALILVALAAGHFYLKTDHAQNLVKTRVNQAIPGHIDWKRADISILGGTVGLHGATVYGPGGGPAEDGEDARGEPIIQADYLLAEVGIPGLLRGSLVIGARLDSPRVLLARDADGTLNIARAFSDPDREKKPEEKEKAPVDSPFAINIIIESARISDGFFEFENLRGKAGGDGGSAFLSDINLEIDDARLFERSGRASLRIGEGLFAMGDINIPLERFVFESVLEEGRVRPLMADVKLAGDNGGPHLSLTGGASEIFANPELDMVLEASAELDDIRRMFVPNLNISGKTSVSLTASGDPGNPSARLAAQYDGGGLAGVAVQEIDLKADLSDLAVAIETLSAGIPGASAAVSGTVDLAEAFQNGLLAAPTNINALSYDLAIDGKSIDFAQLQWTRTFLSGTADADITLRGTGVLPKSLAAGVEARISGRDIAIGGMLLPIDPEIGVSGGMENGLAFADPVTVGMAGTLLRVAGSYAIFENEIDATAKLETPDTADFLDPFGIAVSSGPARLDAAISGPVLQPAIRAELSASNLSYDEIRMGDVALAADLERAGRLRIEELLINNRGSRVVAEGHVDLFDGGFAGLKRDMPASLTVDLFDADPTDFYPHAGVTGAVNGRVHLAEKITAPALRASIKAKEMAVGDTRIGDMKTEIMLSDGTLEIESLRAENRQSVLRLAGRADIFEPGSLKPLEVPILDLVFPESDIYIEDFVDDAAGRVTIDGSVSGKLTELVADLSLYASNLEAGDNYLGHVSADVRFADSRLYLAPFEINNNRSAMMLTGSIDLLVPGTMDLLEDPAIRMEIEADEIHLADFVPAMSGRFSVAGRVEGSLYDPEGEIEFSGEQINTGVQRIESITVSSTFSDKTVFVDTAQISLAPGETMRGEGFVSLDKRFFLEISSDDIGLQRVGALADTGVSGIFSIEAAGEGHLADPDIEGRLSIRDLAAGSTSADPIDVFFRLKNRVAGAVLESTFTIDAEYHIDTGDFDLRAELEDTLLDPFFHMAGLDALSGTVTADVQAGGNVSDIQDTSAEMNILRMTVFQSPNNAVSRELIRIAGLYADFTEGRLTIPDNEIALLETSRVHIAGSGRLDGDLEATARGNIPFSVISAFFPVLEDPDGNISFSANFARSDGHPDFDAEVEINDLGMTVPHLMQQLHGINGRIRIAPHGIELTDLSGRLDAGRFSAEGVMAFEDGFFPGRVRLDVAANAFPIRIPGAMDMVFNSDLTFSGHPDNTTLSGTVILLDGLYYRDVEIDLIGEVTRRRRAAPVAAEPPDLDVPYLRNLNLDVETSFRRPLMVDNNLALMTLRPELRINGTLNRPRLTGRAEVAQGTVSYQNIEFEIARGIIDFVDPYRISPDIDIRAISEVRRWTILLEVSGTPEELDFRLTSNPPEEHADILSLLLLGQTTREFAEGSGPSGPSPEQMLINLLAGRLEEDVRAGTGLDIFEVEYRQNDAGTEADDSIRVTLGKELSRRLTVTYGLERKGGETVQQRTAIYRLLEYLSMSAFQDSAGTFGSEMQFRLEFR